MKIIEHPNNILREDCVDIDSSYEGLSTLISEMFDLTEKSKGIGLAAPQIGLNINLFIVKTNEKYVFINPEIIESSDSRFTMEEGCLSFPDTYVDVERPTYIKVRYFNENFQEKEIVFDILESRVIQHEYDHLRGKLMIDY